MVTKERFAQGMTVQQYLDQMGTNKDTFVKFLGEIKVKPEDKKALESLGKKLKCMVITEDWCGDALYNVPVLLKLIEGNRFPVGELDGSESERVKNITATFTRAGFKSPVLKDIRAEIWLKLWGNLSFNPISALTHSTLVDICQFPLTRQLAADMMTEAQTIAHKLNIEFRVSLEKRIAGAEKVGKHKTSMLQDIEIGRAIEIDALVGAVIELGRLTQTPTPHIDSVYACVKLLAKTLGEEKGKLKIEKIV